MNYWEAKTPGEPVIEWLCRSTSRNYARSILWRGYNKTLLQVEFEPGGCTAQSSPRLPKRMHRNESNLSWTPHHKLSGVGYELIRLRLFRLSLFRLPWDCDDWNHCCSPTFLMKCTCLCSKVGSRTCFPKVWPPRWMRGTGRTEGRRMYTRSRRRRSLVEMVSRSRWCWHASWIWRSCGQRHGKEPAGDGRGPGWWEYWQTRQQEERVALSNACLLAPTARIVDQPHRGWRKCRLKWPTCVNVHSWEEWLSAVQELPTFTQLLRAFVIGGPIRELIFGRSIYSNWLLSMGWKFLGLKSLLVWKNMPGLFLRYMSDTEKNWFIVTSEAWIRNRIFASPRLPGLANKSSVLIPVRAGYAVFLNSFIKIYNVQTFFMN